MCLISLLAMEVLHQNIQEAAENGAWSPIKLSRKGLSVSHLFFADDLLLFGEASVNQAAIMKNILENFVISHGNVSIDRSCYCGSNQTPQGI